LALLNKPIESDPTAALVAEDLVMQTVELDDYSCYSRPRKKNNRKLTLDC